MRRLRAQGLTLVELLVVIAITAMLLATLLVGLGRAREVARQVACSGSLRQIGNGSVSYAVDHMDHLPTYWGDHDLTFDTVAMRRPSGEAVNLGLLLPYVPDAGAYYCAAATRSPDLSFDAPTNKWNGGEGKPGSWLSSTYATRFKAEKSPRIRTVYSEANRITYSEFIGVDGWGPDGRFKDKVYSPHDGEGYNLLFGDGAVHWVQSTAVNSLRKVGRDAPGEDEMLRYYRVLDILPAGGGSLPVDDDHHDDHDSEVEDGGDDDH